MVSIVAAERAVKESANRLGWPSEYHARPHSASESLHRFDRRANTNRAVCIDIHDSGIYPDFGTSTMWPCEEGKVTKAIVPPGAASCPEISW
jgi:hypothetical protein